MQYIFTRYDTAYSCCRNVMFELAVGKDTPLRIFLIEALKNIIRNNEQKYSSHFMRISDHYAIHVEGIKKKITHNKKLNKRWMFSGSSCFQENNKVVLCLKMSLRKKAAKNILKHVFLRKKDWGCIELDSTMQYSLGICGDIQNLVSFLNQSSIDDVKDDHENGVQKIMSYIIPQNTFDDTSFEDISQIEKPIIK